jgi:hypothetical protein
MRTPGKFPFASGRRVVSNNIPQKATNYWYETSKIWLFLIKCFQLMESELCCFLRCEKGAKQ